MSPEEKKMAFLDALLLEIEAAHTNTAERMCFNVSMGPEHLGPEAMKGIIGSVARFSAFSISMHRGFLEDAVKLDKLFLEMIDKMAKGSSIEELGKSPVYVATFTLHAVLIESFKYCKQAHENLMKKGIRPE